MVKQISLVIEIEDYEDELDFLKSMKEYIKTLKRPRLVGIHVKDFKNFEKGGFKNE